MEAQAPYGPPKGGLKLRVGPRRVGPRRVKFPKGGAPKGGAPEGWGPRRVGPEGWASRRVVPRRVGLRRVGLNLEEKCFCPEGGRPKISVAFFFPLPPPFRSDFVSIWVSANHTNFGDN